MKNSFIRYYIFIVISFIGFTQELTGRHIIGGDMYYECLGNDRYRFTMVVYRDCQAAGGAQFDSAFGSNSLTGTVTVYREDSNIPFIRTINLDPPVISEVSPEVNNPCLVIPPNVCVEKGVYTFEVSLPNSDFAYQVVYQRCCRNNSITNINRPGETGATYTVEINSRAQDNCNSSIRFGNFPPIVICNGSPLEFEHFAFDPDSDTSITIEYEFCSPYQGGGMAGSTEPGDSESFNGVAPNPDAPPPYAAVDFVGGNFTSSTPLGGDPVVQIDPQTGLITGTPTSLGQYVVGVCATEFDSAGNVLSVIRRDFQFNVAECESRVFAEISADLERNGEFVINSCGESTISFVNESFQEEFIESYRWEFDINGTFENYFTRNPTISFPGLGTYNGIMYLNEGTICEDSARIEVNIYGDISNSLEYDYDTCVAGPISLMGFDSTGNENITERVWYFENNDSLTGQNVMYEYLSPGNKRIQYKVTDNVGCTSVAVLNVPYFPIPNEINVATEFLGNCAPVRIFFDNQSYPLDESYSVDWDFGDGGTSMEISPVHIYEQPGNYTVNLTINSPIGCHYEGELDQIIEVIPSPVADFTYTPAELSQFQKRVNFIDQSMDAAEWMWDFSGEGQSMEQNPVYQFPDTGLYTITQIVTHLNGCMDTLSKLLDIVPKPTYFLPNAFTPNNDGRNDEYLGRGDLIGVRDFEMTIFNRWGEMVFQTQDPYEGWNGRKNNSGHLLSKDVYVVQVRFVGPRDKLIELNGFATLVQ